jgi:hypothetical protein
MISPVVQLTSKACLSPRYCGSHKGLEFLLTLTETIDQTEHGGSAITCRGSVQARKDMKGKLLAKVGKMFLCIGVVL